MYQLSQHTITEFLMLYPTEVNYIYWKGCEGSNLICLHASFPNYMFESTHNIWNFNLFSEVIDISVWIKIEDNNRSILMNVDCYEYNWPNELVRKVAFF